MNYLPKNRFRNSYLKKVIVLVAVFISGVIAFSFFGSSLILSVSPLWQAENAVSRNLKNSITFFNYQKSLVEENAMLKERLSSLEIEISSLSKDRDERDNLLGQMGRRQNSNAVIAAVLTHPPQTPYDVVIIDAGASESITIGSRVSLPEGPILGLVSEVFSRNAKVRLFSSAGEDTSAVLERGGVPVTLVGVGGGNFKLNLPRDIEVEIGDRILSPNVFSDLLAVVGGVNINATDSFKEVLAISAVNIFSLRFVFVTP